MSKEIEKARLSCFNSGYRIEDHFVDVTEMIEIGGKHQEDRNQTTQATRQGQDARKKEK